MPDTAPQTTTKQATLPAQTIAAAADQAVCEAPFDGTVSAVTFTAEAAVTGNDAATRTFTLVNKGQAGAGAVVVATLALPTGVNLVAFDEKAFTLSAVAGATTVVAGDELVVAEAITGAGLVNPGGLIQVEFSR